MANQLACADCAHHSTCIHLHHIDSRKATCIFSPSRFAVNQTRRADKAEARVKELERERDEARAEALRILRLCADRPNLDHIPFQPAPVEDWFNRIDNAEKGGA